VKVGVKSGVIPGNGSGTAGIIFRGCVIVLPATSTQHNMQTQARHWCFTLNNPEGQLDVDFESAEASGHIAYVIWQMELSESGTVHYQGYLELSRSQRLSFVKNLLPRAHFEIRRGSRDQARDYARKDDSRIEGPWEIGSWVPGSSGRRTDLAKFAAEIESGSSALTLFKKCPEAFIQYQRGMLAGMALFSKKRDWRTEFILVLGPTRYGKTEWVKKNWPDAYWKVPNSKWWPRYEGEETVVLDEYYGWLPFSEVLRLGDSTPYQVENKGNHIEFLAKRVIFISNRAPIEWYSEDVKKKHAYEALLERFTCIRYFTEKYKEPLQYNSYADWKDDKYVDPGTEEPAFPRNYSTNDDEYLVE